MPEHRTQSLPTLGLDTDTPGLLENDLVRLAISYPCICGANITVSEVLPTDRVATDPFNFSYHVQDLGRRAREAWAEHCKERS